MARTPAARSHPRLNREVILDAAMELIERDGQEALSMRRLGSALGVEGMAVYHYFAGRAELLAAIADRLLGPLGELDLEVEWREASHRFGVALREIATRRPATFQLLGMQPLDGQGVLGSVERLLASLVEGGFGAPEALVIYRAVVSYARGYALAETAGFTVDAAHPAARGRLESLPVADFPILSGRARELAVVDADGAFELGLRALLDGFGLGGAPGQGEDGPQQAGHGPEHADHGPQPAGR